MHYPDRPTERPASNNRYSPDRWMDHTNEDPVLQSARREAIVAVLVWVAATAWSVGYCAWHGYGREIESLTFVLWFPDWIFWGIVAPWLACVVVSIWYAFGFMRDEDLGTNDQDEDDDPFQPADRDHG